MKKKLSAFLFPVLLVVLSSCATKGVCSDMRQFVNENCIIVRSSEYCERTAADVIKLKKNLGEVASITDSTYSSDGKIEILVGPTNRDHSISEQADLGPLDYIIKKHGDVIVVLGGCSIATSNAVNRFIELLDSGEIADPYGDFEFRLDFWAANEIITLCSDSTGFIPVWQTEGILSPSWVGDFHEKIYVASHDDCRVLTYSHRGDMVYYPENSLEGLYSAYIAGADVIETDFRMTRDGVPVLMHDATLTRTTDAEKYIGKEGFPASAYLKDWTFEQLRCLRLEMSNGDTTGYLVPTVYEALELLGNKVFFILEDKENVALHPKYDMYPYACTTGSYGCFLFELGGRSAFARWADYEDAPEDLGRLSSFVTLCFTDGLDRLPSLTVFWKDPDCSSWPMLTMAETPDLWSKYVRNKARYIGTNQIVEMCRFFNETMTAAEYGYLTGRQ